MPSVCPAVGLGRSWFRLTAWSLFLSAVTGAAAGLYAALVNGYDLSGAIRAGVQFASVVFAPLWVAVVASKQRQPRE